MKKALIGPNDNLTGRLLVAAPVLSETVFAQSVVYLCAHSQKEGAMGLIINRRLLEPKLENIFTQLEIEPNPPERSLPLCMGGPVDPSRGFVLHSPDWKGEGGLDIKGETILTSGLDVLREVASGRGPKRACMVLGHASWGPMQLEDEIFKDSSWLVAPSNLEIVFGLNYGAKWIQALRYIDVDPLLLSTEVGEV